MNMKTSILYCALLLLLVSQACEKDPAFSFRGEDRIYFAYPKYLDERGQETQWEVDSIVHSFALMPEDVVHDTVWVSVKRVGERAVTDKTYAVTVVADSSTAIEGKDFETLKPAYVFRKNLGIDSLPIIVYRKYLNTVISKNILLKLKETPDFKIGFLEYETIGITITDVLPRPKDWSYVQGLLGDYNYLKYEKWIELTDNMEFGGSSSYRNYYCSLIKEYFNNQVITDPITGERVTCNL